MCESLFHDLFDSFSEVFSLLSAVGAEMWNLQFWSSFLESVLCLPVGVPSLVLHTFWSVTTLVEALWTTVSPFSSFGGLLLCFGYPGVIPYLAL